MKKLMAATMGSILASLLVGSSLPSGVSPMQRPSPSIHFSQIIESNPRPPTAQHPTPPIEQNPGPRIEENPTPPIEQNPTPPMEKPSM